MLAQSLLTRALRARPRADLPSPAAHLQDLLARKLRKYKERKKARSEGVAIKDLTADLEEEEEEDEGEAMMEGMPVDEAGVLLSLIHI